MKKVLLVCLLAAVILIPVFSETSGAGKYKNAVAIDPIWLLLNTYKGSYERIMTDQISLQVEVAYSPNFFWGLHEYEKLTYLDLIVEGRYYFGHFLADAAGDVNIGKYGDNLSRIFTDGPGGLYIGLFGGYVNSVAEDGEGAAFYNATINGIGGGLELGCKYIFGDRDIAFFLEPYGVLQYYAGGFKYKDESGNEISKPVGFDDGFSRNGLSAGINFGVVF